MDGADSPDEAAHARCVAAGRQLFYNVGDSPEIDHSFSPESDHRSHLADQGDRSAATTGFSVVPDSDRKGRRNRVTASKGAARCTRHQVGGSRPQLPPIPVDDVARPCSKSPGSSSRALLPGRRPATTGARRPRTQPQVVIRAAPPRNPVRSGRVPASQNPVSTAVSITCINAPAVAPANSRYTRLYGAPPGHKTHDHHAAPDDCETIPDRTSHRCSGAEDQKSAEQSHFLPSGGPPASPYLIHSACPAPFPRRKPKSAEQSQFHHCRAPGSHPAAPSSSAPPSTASAAKAHLV